MFRKGVLLLVFGIFDCSASLALAAPINWTIDPFRSPLNTSIDILRNGSFFVSGVPQGVLGLKSFAVGSLQTSRPDGTLQFLGGHSIGIGYNGVYEPKSGGFPGSEPGNFGVTATISGSGAKIAVRNASISLSSLPLDLNPAPGDPSGYYINYTTGQVSMELANTFDLIGVGLVGGADSVAVEGNPVLTPTLIAVQQAGNQLTMTIPIHVNDYIPPVAAFFDEFFGAYGGYYYARVRVDGQIVATAFVPEPHAVELFVVGLAALGGVAWRRRARG